MKITRINQLDGLELKEATFQGHVFPAHFHDSYSVGLIEVGIEQLTFDDRSFAAPALSVVVINPFDVHANAAFDADPWRYRALYLPPELLRFAARQLHWPAGAEPWFPREVLRDEALVRLLLALYELPDGPGAAVAVLNLTTHLVRHHATTRPDLTFAAAALRPRMADAAAYITAHAAEPLTLNALAVRYRLTPAGFSRAFKQTTGLPPIAYALLHRITRAKALIGQGLPLVEVALETGFYDQPHFTHYFKRYMGVTPVAYRRAVGPK